MQIKAAVLESIDNVLIKSIYSRKLFPGQVLIKILYSGVCRSQLMEIYGLRGEDKWLPHLLGHEGSGIVVEVGECVTKVEKGDEVILTWMKSKGMDAPGALYDMEGKVINSGPITTFSNYSVISENRIVKKPKNLNFDSAVLFGCALQTGAGMVFNQLKPSLNKNLIIMGLGGIGISALLAAQSMNLKNIIAIDKSEEKLKLVSDLGIKYTFNSKTKNLKKIIFNLTGGGADYCIESAGFINTIEKAFSLLNPNHGELLFASHPAKGKKIKIDPHELISGKKISGSWGGDSSPDNDIPIIFNKFEKANINLTHFTEQKYLIEDINQAFFDLKVGKALRPIIKMYH